MSKSVTITINQDLICEDDPNEYFYFTLSLVSPTHRIILSQPRTKITIDDSLEAECSKYIAEHRKETDINFLHYIP